jgi:hypothetical protein
MNDKIATLRKRAMETYTYSDCDGDNNRGTRLNEEKFAELIIQECMDNLFFHGHDEAANKLNWFRRNILR